MIQCTNCGQVNNDTSNFCRFCGTKFLQSQTSSTTGEAGYEYSPPRPYSWKTDEYQVTENKKPRPPQTINQVQPIGNPWATHQSPRPEPLVHQQQNMAHGYHCPRCSSQLLPILTKRISTAGWITFAVLMVMFFPLFWIGLLIKEDVRICPVCSFRVSPPYN